jgi:heme exporter protein A
LADDSLALDRELPLGRALAFWGGQVDPPMEALGIAHLAQVPVRLLSTGQLKRATLARVAASDSPLWLLDEPLNGLDAAGVARFAQLTREHRESGGAVVAASHQPLPGEWRVLRLGEGEVG